MKVLGIIPARGGSKGIPGKNIKLLGGKPLIQYTIEAALQSEMLERIIVSTDSQSIATVAKQLGADVPFIRPMELAQDDTPTLPVIQHALKWLEQRGQQYDAVCLLQPTTPFRPVGFIDQAIEGFKQSGADSLVSVLPVPAEYNPHWTFEPNERGFLKIATGEKQIIPRRQELPSAYIRDGAIYITKVQVIVELNSLYGNLIDFIVSEESTHVNLDTLDDWERALELHSLWRQKVNEKSGKQHNEW